MQMVQTRWSVATRQPFQSLAGSSCSGTWSYAVRGLERRSKLSSKKSNKKWQKEWNILRYHDSNHDAAITILSSAGRGRSKVSATSLPAEKPVDKESQRSNAEKEKVSAKEVQLSDSKSSPELKEINETKEPKKLIEHVQHAVQHARKDGLKDVDGHCEPLLGVRKAKSGRHRGSKTVTQLIAQTQKAASFFNNQ